MNILFLHRNFHAQYRHIATELAKDPNNTVVFITNNDKLQIQGIKKVVYKLKQEVPKDCHRYLKFYEESIIHGQATAEAALVLKNQGFKPDIIYGNTLGNTMFMKDIFPDVPLLCSFEWFYNPEAPDADFDEKSLNEDERAKLRCNNSHLLVDLYSCDAGICPTNWQKSQFPKELQNKIKVLHDGVDTELCVADKEAKFLIKDKNLELTVKDEVITYAARGMEAYRGFPEFMRAAAILLKKRPNLHVIIEGEDEVCYGSQLVGTTYKQMMLKELNLDMNRVHFVGRLPFNEYVKLLQISSVHVYLTYPFVLSRSLLEAMSCECCIVASGTKHVLEVLQNNQNALLFDFNNVEQQVERIEFALDNQDKMEEIRHNARKTIVDKYDLNNMIQKQINLIKTTIELKQNKINPLLIQVMIGEEAVCSRVRVTEPNKFLSLIPGVKTVEAVKTADLSIGNSYLNKIFIWQRIWPQNADEQKLLLSNNYLTISEIDDDPMRWAEQHTKNDFFAFRSCHGIQASTEPIAEFLRQYNPNVKVFKNHLAYLPPARTYTNKKVNIFFGALNREDDWKPIISSLNKIISDYSDKINVKVIYDKQFFDALNTQNKDFVPFSPYNVYEKILRECDIAILPLEFNRFNSMKSDLKFIESAGHGVTVLASPTVYGKTIIKEKTGLIYNSVQEFEEKLIKLINDESFRHELAENAYNYVAENRLLSMHYQERAEWYYEMIYNKSKLNEELKLRAPELFT